MALAIGVKKGSKLKIGSDTLEVLEVQGLNVTIKMSYHQPGKSLTVTDQMRDKLQNQVFVSTARSSGGAGRTRLVFEAPSQVKIYRVAEENAAV
jgi:sRNA-binding carbon storage regulator CsrA